MNARQAAKAASERIADLEISLRRAMSDIKRYNQVIDSMIAGGDPCDYCEDCKECHLSDHGRGCKLWMLKFEEDEDGSIALDTGTSGGAGGRICGIGPGGTEVSADIQ